MANSNELVYVYCFVCTSSNPLLKNFVSALDASSQSSFGKPRWFAESGKCCWITECIRNKIDLYRCLLGGKVVQA